MGLFEPTQLEYGGRRAAGLKVTCVCGKFEKVTINTIAHSSERDGKHKQNQQAQRKFEKLGWRIGDRERDHRCPGCVEAILRASAGNNRAVLLTGAAPVP